MANVRLERVSKHFDGVKAVDDVSLEIRDREFVVLLGPSGCGKTTLLRMIAGLETPSSGAIYIDNRLVNFVAPKDRDIAMVFQNYALYPHMQVADNITLGLKLRRSPGNLIRERLQAASTLLGVDKLLRRMPRQLSGGQQQRVALGRAIVREPKVFLMDEPLSNLDSRLRVHMRAELIKLHRRLKATAIYVTHDQSEAMTMASRVAVMNNGEVHQFDAPLAIYHHPADMFVASFIGNPEMNFLPAELASDSAGWWLTGNGFRVGVPASAQGAAGKARSPAVWLGVRPEAIRLGPAPAGAGAIEAVVEIAEPLGARTLVYCRAGETTVVADISSDKLPSVGDSVALLVDPSKTYAFERDGNRIAIW
jgi:multiple sugar transport system ATP-binding protein